MCFLLMCTAGLVSYVHVGKLMSPAVYYVKVAQCRHKARAEYVLCRAVLSMFFPACIIKGYWPPEPFFFDVGKEGC